MALVRVVDLQFEYDDGTRALADVNLDLTPGSFSFLLGRNGAGKTTLLHLLSRLLRPRRGMVYLRGRPLDSLPAEEVYRAIGLVFQDPNDQLFGATVADDVAFGPRNLGLAPAEVEARVAEALGMVGLADLARRPVHGLSFGQKRRLAIGGVLAMRPEVLLLDEPAAGLDPEGREGLMRLLAQFNARGLTILMTSHDLDLAAEYATRIYVLDAGRLVMAGEPVAVMGDMHGLRAAGLRPPRTAPHHGGLSATAGVCDEGAGGDVDVRPLIQVVGLGPGGSDYLTPLARRAIMRAEALVGGRRALAAFPGVAVGRRKEIAGDLEQVVAFIKENEGRRVVVLVSGDPGLYSFLDCLLERIPRERIEVVPGISAVQLAFARAKLPWHDARIVTMHVRAPDGLLAGLLAAVRDHHKVAVLTDRRFPPEAIARYLLDNGVRGKRVTVADNLSYPCERVVAGSLEEVALAGNFTNAVVVIEDEPRTASA